jgi:hypothetical protein
MAAALQKTKNMCYTMFYTDSANPCGNCKSNILLEEWAFRFEIVEQNPVNKNIIKRVNYIPFYCKCINGFFSEKELSKFITDIILSFFCAFDENDIKNIINKYYKYIDDEEINKHIIELDKNHDHFCSNILKIFLETYESLVHVNLKPAKK